MLSLFSIVGLAAQIAIATAANSPFNLQITDPPYYDGTYISLIHGHVGAGIDLWLISAGTDPNFYFSPSADDPSTGEILYDLFQDGSPFEIGLYAITPGLGAFATAFEPAVNFTFTTAGELQVASSNGFLLACNTTINSYATQLAINYFNGTGTPDYTQCFNVTIVKA